MAKTTKKTAKPAKKTAKKAAKKTTKAKKTAKTKNNAGYTHIIAVLDRSGSMGSVKQAAIDGFNEFLKTQQALPGKATMTVILFDDKYEILHDSVKLQDVPELTEETFVPRGMTALFSSMGRAIGTYKASLLKATAAKRPDKVLMITITDGADNVKGDYSQENVANMVKELKADGKWQFLFLCSEENAVLTSQQLGISTGNTLKFTNSAVGNKALYKTVAAATSNFRSKSLNDADYTLFSANLISNVDNTTEEEN
jgi:hypothetical protein